MHATVTADWARDFGDVLTPMDDGGDAFPVFPRPYLAVDLDLGPNELDRKVAALVPAGGECRWPKAWRRRHVHGGIPGVRDSRSIAGGGGSDLSWSAEVLLDRLERHLEDARPAGSRRGRGDVRRRRDVGGRAECGSVRGLVGGGASSAAGSWSPSRRSSWARLRRLVQRWVQLPVRVK